MLHPIIADAEGMSVVKSGGDTRVLGAAHHSLAVNPLPMPPISLV